MLLYTGDGTAPLPLYGVWEGYKGYYAWHGVCGDGTGLSPVWYVGMCCVSLGGKVYNPCFTPRIGRIGVGVASP